MSGSAPGEAAGLTRVSVGTFGELDVRTLLAVAGAPAVDATGSGWAGGRTALYRSDVAEAALVALAWDSAATPTSGRPRCPSTSGSRFGLAEHTLAAAHVQRPLVGRSANAVSRSTGPARGRRARGRGQRRRRGRGRPFDRSPNPRLELRLLITLGVAGGATSARRSCFRVRSLTLPGDLRALFGLRRPRSAQVAPPHRRLDK